jgi:hypothetical protein
VAEAQKQKYIAIDDETLGNNEGSFIKTTLDANNNQQTRLLNL